MRRFWFFVVVALLFVSSALTDKLILPDGLVSVGKEAFMGDQSLDEVVLPEGIISIGERAFANSSVRKINLPASLTSIPDNAFENCRLESVKAVPGTEFYDWAFENGLIAANPAEDFVYKEYNNAIWITGYIGKDTTVIVPDEIDGLPVAYVGQTSGYITNYLPGYTGTFISPVTSVILPDSVKELVMNVFTNNESLTYVHLPEGIETIPRHCFMGCTALEEVFLPSSVKYIGPTAFTHCYSLTDAHMPDGLLEIQTAAFSECISLNDPYIPESVTNIEDRAFQGCSSMTTVTLPTNITTVSRDLFQDCVSLTSVHFKGNIDFIMGHAFDNTGFTDFALPSSISRLHGCFQNCSQLKSFHFPDDYQPNHIPEGMFSGCKQLRSISLPDVLEIKNYAFAYCESLRWIYLPESVESIRGYAFYHCTHLKTLTISNHSAYVAENAFDYCTALESIQLPESHNMMTNFQHCVSLRQVNIPGNTTQLGDSVFYNCISLTDIYIPPSVTYISLRAFQGCANLKTIRYEPGSYAEEWVNKYACQYYIDITLAVNQTYDYDILFPDGRTENYSLTSRNNGIVQVDGHKLIAKALGDVDVVLDLPWDINVGRYIKVHVVLSIQPSKMEIERGKSKKIQYSDFS